MTGIVRGAPQYTRMHPDAIAFDAETSRAGWWGPLAAGLVTLVWAAGVVVGFQTSLLLLTLVGFATLVVGLRYPVFGLFGIMVLCILDAPARVYIVSGTFLRWNTLNYWLVLMMLLYLPFLMRLRDPHSVSLAALVALLLIEVIVSPDITNGTQNVLGILAVFGILIYFVRAGEDSRMWFWMSVSGGLMGALGGLVFFLQKASLPPINENAWAGFPLTALVSVLLGFPHVARSKRGQPTLLALAAVNLAWIFLSGSRGVLLIGSCCFVVLLVGLRGMRQRTMAFLVAGVITFAAAAHFGNLQDRAIHRLTKLFTPEHAMVGNYSLTSRTSGRSDLAIGGWYIFQEHPFGVGTGGFPTAWSRLGRHYSLTYGRGEEKAAHSGWVKTMVENGVPGLVLLIIYVSSFGVVALRQRDWALWRLGMLTSVATAAALLSTEFQNKGVWFLVAGATAFLQRDRLVLAMYGRVPEREQRLPGNDDWAADPDEQ